MSRILIVDDEPSICWGLVRLGEGLGHEVEAAASAEHGLRVAEANPPDLLILDVRLPGMDGLSAMKSFRRLIGDAPIIVITAFGDLATAVRAVEEGAFEYVLKPFDLHEIRAAVQRALQAAPAASSVDATLGVEGMLGQSPAMQAAFKRIALAAASDAPVLLAGESGVGKKLAAAAIHRHSARADGPFVAVNISALSPALAEAELFGYAAAASSGAASFRKGLLVQADGGTLLLDEVADFPLPLQVKLLRALDQNEVFPLGADSPVRTQFRVISATHQNLVEKVEAGEFRADLFFRLATFEIALPPLRDRAEDVALLARHFAHQIGGPTVVLAAETIAVLQRRPWHGNVRELHSAVAHALVLARSGAVLPSHLPAALPNLQHRPAHQAPPVRESLSAMVAQLAERLLSDPDQRGDVYERFLEQVEPPLLATAMTASGDRCATAARALGLHRTTLRKKLDQYGLEEDHR